jgi:hypothetical protein
MMMANEGITLDSIRGILNQRNIAPRSTIDFNKVMMTADEGLCQY